VQAGRRAEDNQVGAVAGERLGQRAVLAGRFHPRLGRYPRGQFPARRRHRVDERDDAQARMAQHGGGVVGPDDAGADDRDADGRGHLTPPAVSPVNRYRWKTR
jgi:hypothetical protein